jgi:serine/threonine protein kinase
MTLRLFQQSKKRLGKYEILGKLARGGFASVYKGRDPDTDALVAIKVLKPEIAAVPQLLRRFQQEFLAASNIDNPNIVRALDFGQEGGVSFLVMEYVDGQDLCDIIAQRGRLSEAAAVAIIRQIGHALHQAHEEGMIHRDVKPDNILLLPDGQAKLTDFGIVKDLDSEQDLTETASVLGNPNFMAPEQFENCRKVDRRCDIYSLAATLYMAVTAKVPFEAHGCLSVVEKKLKGELVPPRSLAPALSARAEEAILRALSVDPALRPSCCLTFLESLNEPTDKSIPAGASASPSAQGRVQRRSKGKGTERRRAMRHPCRLETSCWVIGGDPKTDWKAKLKDVSKHGVSLLLSRRFEPGTVLHLELRGAGATVVSRLLMKVVHAEPHASAKGWWNVGGLLACDISRDELRHFQAAALKENGVCALLPSSANSPL